MNVLTWNMAKQLFCNNAVCVALLHGRDFWKEGMQFFKKNKLLILCSMSVLWHYPCLNSWKKLKNFSDYPCLIQFLPRYRNIMKNIVLQSVLGQHNKTLNNKINRQQLNGWRWRFQGFSGIMFYWSKRSTSTKQYSSHRTVCAFPSSH